ncbi:MAG: PepSY domain-containing protein [Sinimarinibacterium sp.]|jgi:hypothetical protein
MTRRRPRRRVSLYVAHRWAGALAALFVLFIATTGLVLNHAADWRLDRQPVRSDLLLDAYGIDVPLPGSGFRVDAHWISASAGTTYWDTRPVGSTGALLGVARTQRRVLAVGREAALLLDDEGQLLERSTMTAWPAAIAALRASSTGFVVTTPSGEFQTDPDLLSWAPHVVAGDESRLDAEPLPGALAAQIRADARARSITWERVLLDLHSGRLPGRAGVLIADLVALAMIGLALSGLGLWVRHLKRQRAQQQASGRHRAGP